MELKNNTIKMKEILNNPQAKAILKREFPEFMNPLMIQMASNMTLAAVLNLAKSKFPQNKIESVISELKKI